jgi:hypothetical protein
MRRLNFHIEQETIEQLNARKKKYGQASIASFIRFIVLDFLRKEK